MSDFLNRMQAQRVILKIVNGCKFQVESLNSLTKKSIERWALRNELKKEDSLVMLLFRTADKVFFLANKSQEQITDSYKKLSHEVEFLTNEIKKEVDKRKA